MTYRILEQMVR